jgi:hypothetical protein
MRKEKQDFKAMWKFKLQKPFSSFRAHNIWNEKDCITRYEAEHIESKMNVSFQELEIEM